MNANKKTVVSLLIHRRYINGARRVMAEKCDR